MNHFLQCETGIESLEYAIIGGIIVVAAALSAVVIGYSISSILSNVDEQVELADTEPP